MSRDSPTLPSIGCRQKLNGVFTITRALIRKSSMWKILGSMARFQPRCGKQSSSSGFGQKLKVVFSSLSVHFTGFLSYFSVKHFNTLTLLSFDTLLLFTTQHPHAFRGKTNNEPFFCWYFLFLLVCFIPRKRTNKTSVEDIHICCEMIEMNTESAEHSHYQSNFLYLLAWEKRGSHHRRENQIGAAARK